MTTDREFIDLAAKGLKIESRPFKPLAEALGMTEAEVIERIKRLIGEGKVRRFAASVRHQPLGYKVNSMVIARVSPEAIDKVGETARGIEAVSHCYHRAHPDGDPYCVYIMVHGMDDRTVQDAVAKIRSIPGLRGIEVAASAGELKKVSLTGVSSDPSRFADDE